MDGRLSRSNMAGFLSVACQCNCSLCHCELSEAIPCWSARFGRLLRRLRLLAMTGKKDGAACAAPWLLTAVGARHYWLCVPLMTSPSSLVNGTNGTILPP